jgi:mannose-6-phosphate isomerase-like protein (cupin superfamily)
VALAGQKRYGDRQEGEKTGKNEGHDYSINLEAKFAPRELIDVGALASSVIDNWFNQTLCRVNDCVVRVGVFQRGEFHWHQHAKEDEFFFVLSGTFVIDLEGRRLILGPRQGFMVPRGVRHKTSVTEPTVILMVEAATVKPTGD